MMQLNNHVETSPMIDGRTSAPGKAKYADARRNNNENIFAMPKAEDCSWGNVIIPSTIYQPWGHSKSSASLAADTGKYNFSKNTEGADDEPSSTSSSKSGGEKKNKRVLRKCVSKAKKYGPAARNLVKNVIDGFCAVVVCF